MHGDTSIIHLKASMKLMCLIWSVCVSRSRLVWLGVSLMQNGLLFREINALEIPIDWLRLKILSNYIVDRWGAFTVYAQPRMSACVCAHRKNALLWARVHVCGSVGVQLFANWNYSRDFRWKPSPILTMPHSVMSWNMQYGIVENKYRFFWLRSWCIFVGVWCRMWNVKNVSGRTEKTKKIGVNAVHLEWETNGTQ